MFSENLSDAFQSEFFFARLFYNFICFSLSEYARENLVMFNIFIKDPYAKRFQKDEKITKTSYIANSGGLLGLCMGFSLISAAEILYHCFFGIYSAIFPSEKKKQRLRARKSDAQHYCQVFMYILFWITHPTK